MDLFELPRFRERPHLRQLEDDVLLDLPAPSDLLEQAAAILGGIGAQHAQRIDAIEEDEVVVVLIVVGAGAFDAVVAVVGDRVRRTLAHRFTT